jgi:hypothetical protein
MTPICKHKKGHFAQFFKNMCLEWTIQKRVGSEFKVLKIQLGEEAYKFFI